MKMKDVIAVRAKGLIPPNNKVGTVNRGKSFDMRKKNTPVIPKLMATGMPMETVRAKHEPRT
jgi:hypothetical protein